MLDATYQLGDRVQIDTDGKPKGTVRGTATIVRDTTEGARLQILFMVELDEGFYSENRLTWVSIVAVDPGSLEAI